MRIVKIVEIAREELPIFLPAVKTCILAIATFISTVSVHIAMTPIDFNPDLKISIFALLMAIAGFLYALVIEYAHHRWILHSKVSGFFKKFYADHIKHHRLFRSKNFQTRDKALLQFVATYWPTFPLIFLVNYLVLAQLAHYLYIPLFLIIAFFTGILIEFVYFEFTHYALHVEGSSINNFFNSYAKQMHHKAHHDKMSGNFGVTAINIDRILKTSHATK